MFGALRASDFAPLLVEIEVFDCSNGGCSIPASPILCRPLGAMQNALRSFSEEELHRPFTSARVEIASILAGK